MASSYGILHNYDNIPLYSPNYDLIAKVEGAKQNALDTNRAKLQTLVDNYASLDIYKGVDKEYAEERLKAVAEMTNQYANMDLSDPGLANSLLKNINQVLDNNVKTAISSTKLFRSEQAEWEEQKTKNPEKYSELNKRFADQFSEGWRNSEKVGEAYQGGGGFREYINVEKNITDTLPKIADQLEAEWIESGEGNGYFRSKITKKAIDRNRVEAALDGMLDQKSREQLRINAWGQYGQLPPEQIKEAYEAYTTSEIENLESAIEKHKSLAEAAPEGSKKRAAYESVINQAGNRLSAIKKSPYDNIGNESAYMTMYTNQFKKNYLDAHSQEPLIIREEVNELDKATRDYELKLSQEQRADDRFVFDIQKEENRQAIALEKLKLQGKGRVTNGTERLDASGNPLPMTVPGQGLGKEEGYGNVTSALAKVQEQETQAIKGMTNIFSGYGLTSQDFTDPGLMAQIKNLSGKDKAVINYKGKKMVVNLTDANVLNALEKFETFVLDDHPAKKAAMEQVNGFLGKVEAKLAEVAANGGDLDVTNLANFRTKFVSNGQGGYKMVPVEQDSHYYANLLYKKGKGNKLSDDEQANLNYYTLMQTIADPKTSKEMKKLLYQKIDKDYRQKTTTGKDLIPDNWYKANRTVSNSKDESREAVNVGDGLYTYLQKSGLVSEGGNTPFQRDKNLAGAFQASPAYRSDFEELESLYNKAVGGDKEAKIAVAKKVQELKKEASSVKYNPYNTAYQEGQFSQFTEADTESSRMSFSSGIAKDLEVFQKSTEELLNTAYGNLNLQPTKQAYAFDKTSTPDLYAKAELILGTTLPKGTVVKLDPILNSEGNPTGEANITYKYQVTKDGDKTWVTVSSDPNQDTSGDPTLKKVTKESAAQLGVNFTGKGRSLYEASYGVNAPVIDLGDGSITKVKNTDIELGTQRYARQVQLAGGSLPSQQKAATVQQAATISPEVANRVAESFDKLEGGVYTFKLESNGSNWDHVMYENGKPVYRVPKEATSFTKEDVQSFKANSQYFNQMVFAEYIVTYMEEMQASSTPTTR